MTHKTRLYLISPPRFALEGFAAELASALSAGDVAAFQLRMKGKDDTPLGDGPILEAAARLLPIVQDAGCAFILNDRPDLAARLGADGVHIGQEDAPYAEARRLMGTDKQIGVTCHNSRHLAMQAAEAGADYVAFGAFFPTVTKDAKTRADPELLSWWQELMEIPCVAIGGVTVAEAEMLARAGADFLAVSAGVWSFPEGPAAAVRAFNAAFDRAQT
ncbi:MAG: thiamine phosphate synthase [Alphaproteobacteria bacterium]|nr:thiamine phosphate synthase [Alphaproteobacteria bacterium]